MSAIFEKKCHGNVKYNIGNGVNNSVITLCSVRWVIDLLGLSLCEV